MRRSRRKYVKYKKERVILSDVLPYEVPLTFSNRHLYDYVLSRRIEIDGEKISVGKRFNNIVDQEIVKLLFGIDIANPFTADGQVNFKEEERNSIPFGYKIEHKENDFRELSIVHPKNQLAVVHFYDKYKDLILYYGGVSPFSIRRPYRIAKYTFFKDRLHLERLAEVSDEIIEQNELEYESLKTFFVYKKYSNVYKFFESYQYHRCEKKFNYLFRFDISKCFDSIYSHSITWALLDKRVVKEHMKDLKGTFGDKFDVLMQALNYNETHGIVIGPEFSRIFAEIILQSIDVKVMRDLDLAGLQNRKDYEIFRYVDDYFVFYNIEPDKEKILAAFRLRLREFKLYLSESKIFEYDKPIITEISIAKDKIGDLLTDSLSYRTEEGPPVGQAGSSTSKKKRGTIRIDSKRLITKFKAIIFESEIEYKDILNYTFAIIEKKLRRIIRTHFEIEHEDNTEREFISAFLELLDFVFFLYSVSPRVNTTIKLCRILRLTITTLNLRNQSNNQIFNADFRHLVFKKIYDNTLFILHKNRSKDHTQVETLYLLVALRELGNKYWLTEAALADYLGITKKGTSFSVDSELNYFTITVSLFYMKNKLRYNGLRAFILEKLIERFEKVNYNARIMRTELVLLLFDTLAYPYVDIERIKRKLLKLYRIADLGLQDKIISARQNWFTKWTDFDFGKELDAKKSQEVY